MIFLRIALLCLAMMSSSIAEDDKPIEIPPEEIRKLFHTSFVPKFELVEVELSETSHNKRQVGEGRSMHIKAFGEDINLWLELGDSRLIGEDTPIYYAKHEAGHPENVSFRRRDGLMQMVGRIFEDPERRASLVIGQDASGSPTVNGFIGSSGVGIRSLPEQLIQSIRRRQRSAGRSDDIDGRRHIVYQTRGNARDLPINAEELRERVAQSNSGLNVPDTLYMEVLLIVENSIFRTYTEPEIYHCLQYLLAFVNGIDLKYRSFEDPKMRLHVSGIVLAEDSQATPYISNNSLGVDVFNTHQALPDSTKFFWNVRDTFPPENYDIALTMTSQAFGVNGSEFIYGQAWVGYVCKRDPEANTVNSVTIIRDDGAFGGVHVAAHEMGHLIGSHHDNNDTTDDCLYTNGFIMSFTPYFTKNSSDFSTCSVDAINNALGESKLDCLFNEPPSVGKVLPKVMPGKVKDLTEQCKSLERKAPCQNPDGPTDICVNMFCTDEYDRCFQTRSAAADGTTCGENKFCLHMECVGL